MKTPVSAGLHDEETKLMLWLINNDIVSVTILSHPNRLIKVEVKTPTSELSQEELLINVESLAE